MHDNSQNTIDPQLFALAAQEVSNRCHQLVADSDDADCLTRTFCSPAMKNAHRRLDSWLQNSKLTSHRDAVGNWIAGNDPTTGKPVFMIGSHLDTVINAGRFDGMLGVLLGLAAVDILNQAGIELNFEIHVIAFSEEEGVRYQLPFIGSRGITGTFDRNDFVRRDQQGIALSDALRQFGCDPDRLESASYAEKNLIGFMEAHIEQAVVLQEANVPVGVVSTIAGQTRATIEFAGAAGHAGTVPHDKRRDALAAAAELILKIEQLGRETAGLFATVGNVVAKPGLSNVISGQAELRLDLRHESDDVRLNAFTKIRTFVQQVSNERQVVGTIAAEQHTSAIPMDGHLSQHLTAAISENGWTPLSLVSGAGHDAMIMANLVPACMLFVRCRDGISHHPDEFVSTADIEEALKVMVGALVKKGAGIEKKGSGADLLI